MCGGRCPGLRSSPPYQALSRACARRGRAWEGLRVCCTKGRGGKGVLLPTGVVWMPTNLLAPAGFDMAEDRRHSHGLNRYWSARYQYAARKALAAHKIPEVAVGCRGFYPRYPPQGVKGHKCRLIRPKRARFFTTGQQALDSKRNFGPAFQGPNSPRHAPCLDQGLPYFFLTSTD